MNVRRVGIKTDRERSEKKSLEEQPGTWATSFGESDAHFGNLVPFHDRHRPDGVVPFHLVTDHWRAPDFLGNEAPQRHVRVDPFEL
ncbi:hypothetical protein D3C78_1081920 [compost metagenome]